MRRIMAMLLLCAAGIMLNRVFNRMVLGIALPLYLDTVGTVAVTLTAGPVWGMLTGALTNILWHSYSTWGWGGYLFTLCNMATAAATYLFVRFFPDELSSCRAKNGNAARRTFPSKSLRLSAIMNRTIVLLLLSFVLCILMSVLGGSISTFIQFAEGAGLEEIPSSSLTLTLFPPNFPVIFAEILSRIPVNLVDRPITVFAGYALHRCFRQCLIKNER